MKERFPTLKNTEVVLSRADVNTGIVLAEDFKYASNSTYKVFTIFDNASMALEAAEKIVAENPLVECYIYKAFDKLLYFLNSTGKKEF